MDANQKKNKKKKFFSYVTYCVKTLTLHSVYQSLRTRLEKLPRSESKMMIVFAKKVRPASNPMFQSSREPFFCVCALLLTHVCICAMCGGDSQRLCATIRLTQSSCTLYTVYTHTHTDSHLKKIVVYHRIMCPSLVIKH